MIASCAKNLARYLLFLFNTIWIIVGSTLLGLGVWMFVGKDSFLSIAKLTIMSKTIPIDDATRSILKSLTEHLEIKQFAYIFIAIGLLIFLIGFLGCCGAARESRCLLFAYGSFILLFLIIQIAIIAYVAGNKSNAEIGAKQFLKKSIEKFYENTEEKNAVTTMWDLTMAELHCCGVDSYLDFQNSRSFNRKRGQVVPETCCKLTTSNGTWLDRKAFTYVDPKCAYSPTPSNSYMNQGCYEVVRDALMTSKNLLYVITAAIIGCQLLTLLFAAGLLKAIRRDRAKVYY